MPDLSDSTPHLEKVVIEDGETSDEGANSRPSLQVSGWKNNHDNVERHSSRGSTQGHAIEGTESRISHDRSPILSLESEKEDPPWGPDGQHRPQRLQSYPIVRKLKSSHEWDRKRRSNLSQYLCSIFRLSSRPQEPTEAELDSLFQNNFYPAQSIPFSVHDFGKRGVSSRSGTLKGVEEYFVAKPAPLSLRWIHVPIEEGRLSEALSKSFYRYIGQAPVIDELEKFHTLELQLGRTSKQFATRTAALNFLRRGLRPWLPFTTYPLPPKPKSQSFWLSYFNSRSPFDAAGRMIELLGAQVPRQLGTESYLEHLEGFTPKQRRILPLTAISIPGVIVAGSVVFCPRNDGTLLSFSTKDILQPRNHNQQWTNVVEYFGDQFWDTTFDDKTFNGEITTEWLMVYIVARLDTSFQGIHGLAVQRQYSKAVSKLTSQKSATLRGERAKRLVLDYVKCMDELSLLQEFFKEKEDHLAELSKNLRGRAIVREREDGSGYLDSAECDTDKDMIQHCEDAVARVRRDHSIYPQMIRDLKSALDVVFQLRTIEQNEATLLAESNNQAILVFTIITIIFLPLSFFTSYFGMNLSDISRTEHTQRYFWAVCGTSTAVIIGLTLIFGFRHRLHELVWENRRWSRAEDDVDVASMMDEWENSKWNNYIGI